MDKDLFAKGENPSVYLDFPVDIKDYEIIDLFNWQEEVKDMISQIELVRMVDVQAETIDRYIKEGKLQPDLEIPMSSNRTFKYFRKDTIDKYVKKYGWIFITPANMKDMFMDMVDKMDMSYSYKPVFLKGINSKDYRVLDNEEFNELQNLVNMFLNLSYWG